MSDLNTVEKRKEPRRLADRLPAGAYDASTDPNAPATDRRQGDRRMTPFDYAPVVLSIWLKVTLVAAFTLLAIIILNLIVK